MGKPTVKPNYRRPVLRLPDLDHCKTAVLNSLALQPGVVFRQLAEPQGRVRKCSGALVLTVAGERDTPLAILLGCGFRRSEPVGLELGAIVGPKRLSLESIYSTLACWVV